MPMRQSTLSFGLRASNSLPAMLDVPLGIGVHSKATSPIDDDTIVVNITETVTQLPTPSESATDVSSESSQTVPSKKMSTSRSKRVSSVRGRKSVFKEDINAPVEVQHDKNRCISGDTLVEDSTTAAEIKLSDNDITTGADTIVIDQGTFNTGMEDHEEDTSVIIVREATEDDTIREEKRVAKRMKMAENAKKWDERRMAAEQSATRKSNRASLLSKATELIDNIKGTVLGKRTRNVMEKEADGLKLNNRSSKKQRTSKEEQSTDGPPPRKIIPPREKKWLISGLYAGQPRMFDARLTENKNKTKSKSKSKELVAAQTRDNQVIPLPMFAGERLLKQGRDFKLPFDVFSPLPAGQPKPDEWKKVNKNVFIGDAAAEWRTNKFDEHSTCSCKLSFFGCQQDCMNRYMYYECDQRNCVFGIDWCGNRPFEALRNRTKIGGKYNVGVEVIKTIDRGYGVRANRSFEPNQIIVEYTGEIITQEECESRMRTIYKDNECYYLMLFDQNMIIDATRGSIARFVNHSCEPNCRMEKWTVGGKPRMALFAGDRGIMTGDELTYDYNFDPYSQKNVQECRCGAKSCRGVLGPKPKPEAKRTSPENDSGTKRKSKKIASKASNSRRKVAAVLSESTNRGNKRGKVVSVTSKKNKSPVKLKASKSSPKRTVLVKKPAARKASVPKVTTKLGRNGSKLKKVLASAKIKTASTSGRRIASSTSSTKALLSPKQSSTVKRSTSLKEKAKIVAKSVRGRSRTITVNG